MKGTNSKRERESKEGAESGIEQIKRELVKQRGKYLVRTKGGVRECVYACTQTCSTGSKKCVIQILAEAA